ncbi:MAG: hypothetical protein DMG21_01480 [Acidobacteria bacterium]|nr:MAG: hypothetical protein DMG21_01480 [Acidobacteriota bacterium]
MGFGVPAHEWGFPTRYCREDAVGKTYASKWGIHSAVLKVGRNTFKWIISERPVAPPELWITPSDSSIIARQLLVTEAQPRVMLPQDGELLSHGKIFEQQCPTRLEARKKRGQEEPLRVQHCLLL